MRILHYLPRVSIAEGGVTRAVLDMTAALAETGEDVVLLTYADEDVPAEWAGAERAPRVEVIDPPAGKAGLFSRGQLRDIAPRLNRADVVHLHAPWTQSNRQFASVCRASGTPYVLSIHGMLDDWSMSQRRLKKRLYLALGGRSMLERAAAVHCTAAFEQEQAQKWFPKGNGVTIPLVFDVTPFSGEIDTSLAPGPARGDAPRLLFLSRVHEKKGLDRLLHAAALLAKGGQPADVLIAGTGEPSYENAMRDLTERLGLRERTHFLGLVTGDAKAALYASADLFVLPTSQENFGFVCPEAMACGTPAVTTKGVDIWPELLESGGAEIAENTPEGVAAVVSELLRHPERLAEMGRRGREWVLGRFSGDRVAQEYRALYAGIVEGGA